MIWSARASVVVNSGWSTVPRPRARARPPARHQLEEGAGHVLGLEGDARLRGDDLRLAVDELDPRVDRRVLAALAPSTRGASSSASRSAPGRRRGARATARRRSPAASADPRRPNMRVTGPERPRWQKSQGVPHVGVVDVGGHLDGVELGALAREVRRQEGVAGGVGLEAVPRRGSLTRTRPSTNRTRPSTGSSPRPACRSAIRRPWRTRRQSPRRRARRRPRSSPTAAPGSRNARRRRPRRPNRHSRPSGPPRPGRPRWCAPRPRPRSARRRVGEPGPQRLLGGGLAAAADVDARDLRTARHVVSGAVVGGRPPPPRSRASTSTTTTTIGRRQPRAARLESSRRHPRSRGGAVAARSRWRTAAGRVRSPAGGTR